MATASHLVDANLATQIHLATILVTVVLAPVQIFRRRKGQTHRVLGYIWVVSMVIAALSSFWISDLKHLGRFSAIHLLSVWVLFQVFRSVRAAIAGRIAEHEAIMRGLALWGLLGAGIFTLAPYRTLNRVLFPGHPFEGFYLSLGLGGLVFAIVFLRGRRVLT